MGALAYAATTNEAVVDAVYEALKQVRFFSTSLHWYYNVIFVRCSIPVNVLGSQESSPAKVGMGQIGESGSSI